MPKIVIGLCTVYFEIPVETLKEKRGILQSLLKRLHNTFNVSSAEIDYHDIPSQSVIAFTLITNANDHAYRTINTILKWLETHYPDALIVDQAIEIL